eukprot:gene8493-11479_t
MHLYAWKKRKFGILRTSLNHISSSSHFDSYCMNTVKERNHDAFIAGLLVAKQYRPVYFAIRAFNVEIAMIKEQIPRNSLQAGKFRFNWWREIIEGIYQGSYIPASNAHPVAQALYYYIPKYNLNRRWFERTMEARQREMINPSFQTLDDIEEYSENAYSSLNYLQLESMNINNEKLFNAASHAGVCIGIVTFLRAFTFHLSNGRLCLPTEIVEKHGLKQEIILNGPQSEQELTALKDAIHDMASQAFAHLEQSKSLFLSTNSSQALDAFLPLVPSSLYLDCLLKNQFDPILSTSDANYVTFRLPWRLLAMKYLKKF